MVGCTSDVRVQMRGNRLATQQLLLVHLARSQLLPEQALKGSAKPVACRHAESHLAGSRSLGHALLGDRPEQVFAAAPYVPSGGEGARKLGNPRVEKGSPPLE